MPAERSSGYLPFAAYGVLYVLLLAGVVGGFLSVWDVADALLAGKAVEQQPADRQPREVIRAGVCQ